MGYHINFYAHLRRFLAIIKKKMQQRCLMIALVFGFGVRYPLLPRPLYVEDECTQTSLIRRLILLRRWW